MSTPSFFSLRALDVTICSRIPLRKEKIAYLKWMGKIGKEITGNTTFFKGSKVDLFNCPGLLRNPEYPMQLKLQTL